MSPKYGKKYIQSIAACNQWILMLDGYVDILKLVYCIYVGKYLISEIYHKRFDYMHKETAIYVFKLKSWMESRCVLCQNKVNLQNMIKLICFENKCECSSECNASSANSRPTSLKTCLWYLQNMIQQIFVETHIQLT